MYIAISISSISNNIDWKGLFNPARDQGGCGSCWAFASSGSVEANWGKQNKTQSKISLSPQQLVDCSTVNYGCRRGFFRPEFYYILSQGLVEEENYKHTKEVGSCNISLTARRIKIENFRGCDDCDIGEWYTMLQQGPIALLMDAGSFQLYNGGLMDLIIEIKSLTQSLPWVGTQMLKENCLLLETHGVFLGEKTAS